MSKVAKLKNLIWTSLKLSRQSLIWTSMRYMDLMLGFSLDHLSRGLEPASFFVDSGMPRPYKGLRNRPVSPK
jgi:hypothetical protein